MTRYQLQQSVYAWLHRANFRSPVPDFDAVPAFIALAEQDINLDLRARCMVERATQLVDGPYLSLPCDYIEALDVRLSTGRELTYRPRSQMGNLLQSQTAGPYAVTPSDPGCGGPAHYDVVGALMEIWPYQAPPDPAPAGWQPYSLEMAYFQRQQLGDGDGATTPVLAAYPGAYLWGALVQSAPFLRDDSRLETWRDLYQSIIFRANAEHERAKTQGSRLVQRFRERRLMDALQSIELGLLIQNAPYHTALPGGIEFAAASYARAPAGPMAVTGADPAKATNKLAITWPQAREDWGVARYVAGFPLDGSDGSDLVLATGPAPAGAFAVQAGDQPRIPPGGLTVIGVGTNARRPFGAGIFGQSRFGSYPPEGAVFSLSVAALGYAWAPQRDSCAPWAPLDAVSGGCA